MAKMKIRKNNSFVNSLHNISPQTTLAEISQINTGSISKWYSLYIHNSMFTTNRLL